MSSAFFCPIAMRGCQDARDQRKTCSKGNFSKKSGRRTHDEKTWIPTFVAMT